MERLTRRSKVGEELPIKHMNLMYMDATSEDTLTEILNRLAEYEDAGMTPEEAIQWRNDAIEATAKLGEEKIETASLRQRKEVYQNNGCVNRTE
jgi:hypothetical protein